jgi:hypothetical protein
MERSLLIMALSINDVIALANAGFNKDDIAAFMNLGTDQNAPPAPAPVPGAPAVPPAPAPQTTPPAPAPSPAPAVPDYAAQLAALAAKIDALAVPNAGTVGNPPAVTSVDDIIRAAVLPKPADGAPANQ